MLTGCWQQTYCTVYKDKNIKDWPLYTPRKHCLSYWPRHIQSPNFKLLRSPRIDSKEPIPPGWKVRYDNLTPTRLKAPIDCLKIPAQAVHLFLMKSSHKILCDHIYIRICLKVSLSETSVLNVYFIKALILRFGGIMPLFLIFINF